MPLYLVRGPTAWGALIRARSLDHVRWIIDEEDDPGACIVEQYDGPLAIEFSLPATAGVEGNLGDPAERVVVEFEREPVGISLDDVPELTWFGETGDEMREHVRELLFPAVGRLCEELFEGDRDEPVVENQAEAERLRSAIADDLDPLRRARWREAHIQRRNDAMASTMTWARITVDPLSLDRGGDIHSEWRAAGWGRLHGDLRDLVGELTAALAREEIELARLLASELTDAIEGLG